MKKILFVLSLMMAVMVSCGEKANTTETTEDVTVDSLAVDSANVDTLNIEL